ncbi:MAG: rRNA maturation RNase YbeY [Chloroflexi bacterium]|nr:rRNA maturation RNase YbeY [Chloroflexota bacterium]
MPRHVIDISNDVESAIDVKATWLRRVVRGALASADLRDAVEVGLLLTGDDRVRQLNRDYRGEDRTTDVLAFALEESEVAFPRPSDALPSLGQVPSDALPSLGQVVVSYPQAVRQAAEYGHTVEREVAFLVVHGLLHLLGFDHQRPDDEARMLSKQEAIMTSLGLPRT